MFFKKISGYSLKYLALFCMLSDHIGIIFQSALSQTVFLGLRATGRLAFPLFAFALTEGFFHTGNRKKYAARLLLFALLSEAPFDFALGSLNALPDALAGQNVFFTLFLGFAAMLFLEKYPALPTYTAISAIFFAFLDEAIRGDCGAAGIFCILLFYSFGKKERREKLIVSASTHPVKTPAPGETGNGKPLVPPDETDSGKTQVPPGEAAMPPDISLPFPTIILCLLPLVLLLDFPLLIRTATLLAAFPITAYGGRKGRGRKYFFYLFYPTHLLLLKLIEALIVFI